MGEGIRIARPQETSWCPGCGDFGILFAMKKALDAAGIPPHRVFSVTGIGQAAKIAHYMNVNAINGLHGRALPMALGVKLARPDMVVVVNGGDGDIFGEGGNHFLHAVRRDCDITCIVHNNQIYGLTKGQASPTTAVGHVAALHPRGVAAAPLDGAALALVLGSRFVARAAAFAPDELADLVRQAIAHRGFSYVEVLQPCPSMNKVNTVAWYKEHMRPVGEMPDYDPADRAGAMTALMQAGEEILCGLLYRGPDKPPYERSFPHLEREAPDPSSPELWTRLWRRHR